GDGAPDDGALVDAELAREQLVRAVRAQRDVGAERVVGELGAHPRRSAAMSSNERPSPSSVATFPVAFWKRMMSASTNAGESSMARQRRPRRSAARSCEPEPENGSRMTSPGRVWSSIGISKRRNGFCVLWLIPTAVWNVGLSRSEEHTSELQSRENLVC